MCDCNDPDETVTKISEPNPISEGEIQTEEGGLQRPAVRKNVLEENRDPIKVFKKEELSNVPCVCVCQERTEIEPTISTRMQFKYVNTTPCDEEPPCPPCPCNKPVFEYPPTKKFLELQKKNQTNTAEKYFCKWKNVDVTKPLPKRQIEDEIKAPSPEASKAKVPVEKASPRPSFMPLIAPLDQDLDAAQPKSGIFINEPEKENKFEDYDSFDLVYKKKPRPPWPSVNECTRTPKKKKETEEGLCYCPKKKGKKKKKPEEQKQDEQEEGELMKIAKRKVSLTSAQTSYNSKDIPPDEEQEFPPGIAKILQKFRRESDIKRFGPQRRKFLRGTLESHSFTDVCQPTLKEFFFGSKEGTMHQGDKSFSDKIRDKQGVCMPVAAFCYSIIKHPNKWTRENIDEILVYGNNLLLQSMDDAHLHCLSKVVHLNVLRKYMTIGDKKFRFYIDDPYIAGYLESDDKTIYNITKALSIFFHRHNSGIIKTKHLAIGVWKQKYLYMFDAKPRTKDLYCCPQGAAVMAVFYDVQSLATVLLKRSAYGNWPFAIHPLKVYRVVPADDPEVDSQTGLNIRSEYNILNENKAVVLGSFDLGDKCFDFSRYKQALPMAVIALVYSRLTPPSAWHRKTVDKILVIGNLFYRECICCTTAEEIKLENIPAIFTIGPYIVEIYIFANVYADVIYRSCVCQLQTCLENFFTKCTNAILQFRKCYLAVWKQRNMYYCFDPYSRNNEAYATRDGCACVSMHSTLESLIETISHNFDKDAVFYIHALKVCKIHRDPVQTNAFPKHISMDEFPIDCFKKFKMKKSKKNAMEKPVTVDYTAIAMRRLLAGESPCASVVEIGSNVESLAMDQLHALMKKCPSKPCVNYHPVPIEDIADLDSASLEDTQIDPPLPQQIEEGIEFMDLDSFGPTMDELEMEGRGEGEEWGEYEALVEGCLLDDEEGMMEEEGDWYYGKTGFSQFDIIGGTATAKINTEITYFPIKRDILYPTCLKAKQAMKDRLERRKQRGDDWADCLPPCPPTRTKSQELAIPTNFVDLPDDTQVILGGKNVAELGENAEYKAPFICIMACVITRKYNILTWAKEIVDYVLKCGNELHLASKYRFDQVCKLEIPRITLGKNIYKVLVEYIFDGYTRQNILDLALDKILFVRSDIGVIVTPSYACAVMFKNHLYYLFDPFENSPLGLSEGPGGKGVAAFARFKDLHSLTTRIMFNKQKRESAEEFMYSRFILSMVRVRGVFDITGGPCPSPCPDECPQKKVCEEANEAAKPKKEAPCGEDVGKIGYQCIGNEVVLVGTEKLDNRDEVAEGLKEDHFICVCACLMLMTTPVEKWSQKKVDLAINYGQFVFCQASDLEISEKRTVKHILIGRNFFDVIIRPIEITSKGANKNLATGIKTLIDRRFTYFLLQFPNACYVVHKDTCGFFHIFDPYGVTDSLPGGWIRCNTLKALQLKMGKKAGNASCYTFYNFEITRFVRAGKCLILEHKLMMYKMKSKPKKEKMTSAFYEDYEWLKMDPVAWSRLNQKSASGKIRGTIENMWHSWDEEYSKDLWSLLGNINQRNERFAAANRGKQTLANLIVGVGMTHIYELAEWNSAVVDSVLVNGEAYFSECVKNIKDQNHELVMEDLVADCAIFPFSFKASWNLTMEGTMFLVRPTQYNLYKALRLFFNNVTRRFGVIMTSCTPKRQVAFGKTKELEYFVFDCDCRGYPMFLDGQDVAYILRMTTLNRLIHVLTLTLRGGDFAVYEVTISDIGPMDQSKSKSC